MGNIIDMDIDVVKNTVGDIEEIYRQLMKYDDKLLNIKNNLKGSQYGQIKKAISIIENKNKQNLLLSSKIVTLVDSFPLCSISGCMRGATTIM